MQLALPGFLAGLASHLSATFVFQLHLRALCVFRHRGAPFRLRLFRDAVLLAIPHVLWSMAGSHELMPLTFAHVIALAELGELQDFGLIRLLLITGLQQRSSDRSVDHFLDLSQKPGQRFRMAQVKRAYGINRFGHERDPLHRRDQRSSAQENARARSHSDVEIL
jgi:hypothetical protein